MVIARFASTPRFSAILDAVRDIPYFVLDDGSQPEGINFYLIERLEGWVTAKSIKANRRVVGSRRLSRAARRKVIAIWRRFLKFLGNHEAHQSMGVVDYRDVKSWHVLELYKQAMLKGVWNNEFEKTGIPTVLSGPSSIAPAMSELEAGCRWLAKQGYIDEWVEQPELHTLQVSGDLRKYSALIKERVGHHSRRRNVSRQNPGDHRPHTPSELKAILNHLPSVGHKLAFIFPIRHGTRLEETIENTYLPGTILKRDERLLRLSKPAFPIVPYVTSFDLDDDEMIGVLPDAETVFLPAEEAEESCSYRIIGKGPKIRAINLHLGFLEALWHYVTGEREQALRMRGLEFHTGPAEAFLNANGTRLTSHALSKAITRANNKLGFKLRVTMHSLRHTYACAFLEAVIMGQAEKDGIEPHTITLQQIEHYSNPALIVLQEFLGHDEMKTTRRYLRKIIGSKIGLQYQKMYNEELDKISLVPDVPANDDVLARGRVA
jgi:hypothetical protein